MNWFFRLMLAAVCVVGLSLDADRADAGRVWLPFQCTDSDGNPQSGCRAYTFEAGTSTIYQLFSDSALSTPHGDFVTADSSGFFPDSYAADDQCIKVSFRESDGTTVIATIDDHCPTLSTSEITTTLLTGTAAAEAIGTSGNVLCKLNAACTHSALYTFNSGIEINSTSAAATAGPTITLSRDSTSPIADDEIGEIVLQGKDDGTGDVDYGTIEGVIIDPSDGAEYGQVQVLAILNGTNTAVLEIGALDSSDTSVTGVNLETGDYYKAGFYAPGTPLASIDEEQTSGTEGGTCTVSTDETRNLNNEIFDPNSVVSITSNQFTLVAGTYIIRWSAPAYKVNSHQTFLYDITGAAEVQRGTVERSADQDGANDEQDVQTRSVGVARVNIASANVYEIRHNCGATQTTTGLGRAGSLGTEVYTVVEIFAG